MRRSSSISNSFDVDLVELKEDLNNLLDKYEEKLEDDHQYLSFIKENISNHGRQKSREELNDLLIQTESYNAFLYPNQITFHGELNPDNWETKYAEAVWEVLEDTYSTEINEILLE